MMYKILDYMLRDLSNYHRKKEDLLKFYIQKRLDQSFDNYSKELEQSLSYLDNRKVQINVIQKINRTKRKTK